MFKDYEYGWYGFNGSYSGKWMDLGYCQQNKATKVTPEYNKYIQMRNNTLKQIPKLKDVLFVYGNYREII